MPTRVHVIGAGLSGLSAAVNLVQKNIPVTLYEAARHAGGRCRSYHDAALDCQIDNGNHLLLSGNTSMMAFLDRIGAQDQLVGPPTARFCFTDVRARKSWTIRPNSGPLPWWIFMPSRRVPGSTLGDYFKARHLLTAGERTTFTDVIEPEGAMYERFWEPLVVGALNVAPERAAAALMRPVMLETFAKGAASCRPLVAKTGLSDTFITPALKVLSEVGATITYGKRLKGLSFSENALSELVFSSETIKIGEGETVVLAVPQWIASDLMPDSEFPAGAEPIVNVHYKMPAGTAVTTEDPVIGVIGGMAQWIFVRDDIVSVTISAAHKEAVLDAKEIAERVWQDVKVCLNIDDLELPKWRVVKERRATFLQTPGETIKRPNAQTPFHNLFLAGDWTNTKLPATIEGSIRSGEIAARHVFASVP